MKKHISIIVAILCGFFAAQGQTQLFHGYANIASRSVVSTGIYDVTLSGFTGGYKAYPDANWAASDLAVSPTDYVMWGNCVRFKIISRISTTPFVIRVQDPALTGALVGTDLVGYRVALGQETRLGTYRVGFVPPSADGNAGAFPGIAPADAACIGNYYKVQADSAIMVAGAAGVNTFEGRSGTVVSASGDYTASEITNVPSGGVAAVTAQAAINELDGEKLSISNLLTGILAIDGTGSGIDADLLDGQSGAYYLDWGNLTGVPSTFTPSAHTHPVADITGILPMSKGGTGLGTLGTANQLLRMNAGATALEYFTPSYLTANQTITLSGAVTGSGTTSISTTLSTNIVASGNIIDGTIAAADLGQMGASTNQYMAWSGTAWIPTTVADNSSTNEIQNLSYTSATRSLGISSGTGVTLPLFNSTDAGLTPLSGGGTTNFLRADGTWAAPPGGVNGSGVANRLAYWSGASALTSSSNFTISGSNLQSVNLEVTGTGNTNGLYHNGTLFLANRVTDNVALGYFAHMNYVSGSNNLAIGYFTLSASTTGTRNTAVGGSSLSTCTSCTDNASLGATTLRATNSNGNTAVGRDAMREAVATGGNNVAIGFGAGYNIGGSGNVVIGANAGANEAGSDKLYIDNTSTSTPLIGGNFSSNYVGINRPVSGLANTLEVGGDILTTGVVKLSDGSAALSSLTFANDLNTGFSRPADDVIGFNTNGVARGRWDASGNLQVNDGKLIINKGSSNTIIGSNNGNTTGTANILIGTDAGANMTTAQYSFCMGYQAGYNITTQSGNTLTGYQTGKLLTSAGNTAYGAIAANLTTASHITAIGYTAGQRLGDNSTAVGYNAVSQTNTASSTGIGYNTLRAGYGADIVAVGQSAAQYFAGSSNTFIGGGSGQNGYASPKTIASISGNALTVTGHGFTVGDVVVGKLDGSGTVTALAKGVNYEWAVTDANTLTSLYGVTITTTPTIDFYPIAAYTNSTALGNAARVTKSNQMVFGVSSITENLMWGKLGIGLTPTEEVDVLGDIQWTGALKANGATGTTGQALLSGGASGPNTWGSVPTGTGTAGQVAFWQAGNAQAGDAGLLYDGTNDRLNIGGAATSAAWPLTVAASESAIKLTSTGTANTSRILFGETLADNLWGSYIYRHGSTHGTKANILEIGQSGSNPIVFSTSTTERARFTGAGLFGIGTDAPAATFEVETAGTGNKTIALFDRTAMSTNDVATVALSLAGVPTFSFSARADGSSNFTGSIFSTVGGLAPSVAQLTVSPLLRVGVNDGAPAYPLDVSAPSGDYTMRLKSTSAQNALLIQSNTTGTTGSDGLQFGTTGTTAYVWNREADVLQLQAGTNTAFQVWPSGASQLIGMTATAASALTPTPGMLVFVNTTDATFTSIGFWGYDGTGWAKLN